MLVENAEALQIGDQHIALLDALPPDSPLVLLVLDKLDTGRRRAPARGKAAKAAAPPARTLPEAVADAGGTVERIERLAPDALGTWIDARAALHTVELAPLARAALVELGPDTERLENELAKLAVWAQGKRVEAEDARRLVTGAIEADVFRLTNAVVRRDVRTALSALDVLFQDGQPVLQILALLQWQVRVLNFATLLERTGANGKKADPADFAKAIRSTPGAILRWREEARRVTRADIDRLFGSLYATDIAIKSGRVEDEEAALTLCVLDLCGVRGASMDELVETIPAPKRR